MNERLKFGSDQHGSNDRMWVEPLRWRVFCIDTVRQPLSDGDESHQMHDARHPGLDQFGKFAEQLVALLWLIVAELPKK